MDDTKKIMQSTWKIDVDDRIECGEWHSGITSDTNKRVIKTDVKTMLMTKFEKTGAVRQLRYCHNNNDRGLIIVMTGA
jgi:curli biogenesis system outer membrane secretion channel CsgG